MPEHEKIEQLQELERLMRESKEVSAAPASADLAKLVCSFLKYATQPAFLWQAHQ
jgi:hypothetical protein